MYNIDIDDWDEFSMIRDRCGKVVVTAKKIKDPVSVLKHMCENDKKHEEFMEALKKIDGLIRGGDHE